MSSRLIVNSIRHTGASSDAISLDSSGNVTCNGTATGFGGGKILQVLQTVKTDVFSTTSNSYVLVTGLTQAITAASTSNKILINVTLYGGVSSGNYVAGFKLAKDGSAMDGNTIGAASGNNAESGTFRFRNATDTHAEES